MEINIILFHSCYCFDAVAIAMSAAVRASLGSHNLIYMVFFVSVMGPKSMIYNQGMSKRNQGCASSRNILIKYLSLKLACYEYQIRMSGLQNEGPLKYFQDT